MRFATLLVLCAVMAVGAYADDKYPEGFTPNTPEYSGFRVGGEDCANAVVIPSLPYVDTGNTCAFLHDYDEVCPYTGSQAPDVVYAYTPCGDGIVYVTLCLGITDYDTKLFIYQDECVPPYYACNDDECTGDFTFVSELMPVVLELGHTYYIVVDGYSSACGNYSIDITGDEGGSPAESPTWGSIKALFK